MRASHRQLLRTSQKTKLQLWRTLIIEGNFVVTSAPDITVRGFFVHNVPVNSIFDN